MPQTTAVAVAVAFRFRYGQGNCLKSSGRPAEHGGDTWGLFVVRSWRASRWARSPRPGACRKTCSPPRRPAAQGYRIWRARHRLRRPSRPHRLPRAQCRSTGVPYRRACQLNPRAQPDPVGERSRNASGPAGHKPARRTATAAGGGATAARTTRDAGRTAATGVANGVDGGARARRTATAAAAPATASPAGGGARTGELIAAFDF